MALTPELQDLLDTVLETGAVRTETVSFDVDGQAYETFVARPDDEGVHPAVLIFSDWTGLNDHARVRAQMLARLGYVAYAGDIYGEGKQPEDPGAEAGRFYGDPNLFRASAAANLSRVKSDLTVDPERVAVMGYCFGGSASLELARSGADVAGIVSFHGNLRTSIPARAGDVKGKVLVLTGAADPVVPDASVVEFEDELRNAGVADWQVHSYSGAMHAFTIPGVDAPDHGAQFNAVANARSWVALVNFLDEALGA
jgi:dienelactone hydrolase